MTLEEALRDYYDIEGSDLHVAISPVTPDPGVTITILVPNLPAENKEFEVVGNVVTQIVPPQEKLS
jgi:hypothetical protein